MSTPYDNQALARIVFGADGGKLDPARIAKLREEAGRLRLLIMKYECAISEVCTKLEVLNKDMALKYQRNPFESIESRLKTPQSIYEKCIRRGYPLTYEGIAENLTDIAGVRVVCAFVDDIYMLSDCLASQDDIRVIKIKDYIKEPKENGYRSLHLIIEIPIFLTDSKEYMKVEVQFRTIAMDFWASVEHSMRYKKKIRNPEAIAEEMRFAAEMINQLDNRMRQIRESIDYEDSEEDESTIGSFAEKDSED